MRDEIVMKAYEVRSRLIAESETAIARAKESAAMAMARSVPGLGNSGPMELRSAEAAQALGALLSEVEGDLARLCARHDYRRLLLYSRLCTSLPVFVSKELPGTDWAGLASEHFMVRYDHNRPLSMWGVSGELHPEGAPLALEYRHARLVAPTGEAPFIAHLTWAREFVEHARRFDSLFEERLGLPVEHALAILRGLRALAEEKGLVGGGTLEGWGRLTGTLLTARNDILDGGLETRAREQLTNSTTDRDARSEDLGRSVARLVDLAHSKTASEGSTGETDHQRGLWAPSLLHGEPGQETWVIDYLSTGPFLMRLANALEISERRHTTGAADHDADVRTSAFDRALGDRIERVQGASLAFRELRRDEDQPNAVVPLSGRGEERELDVPVKLGRTLVAVQTWAREVDKAIEDGDYEVLRRRWRSVKDKLRSTDRRYARELLGDAEGRRCIEAAGFRRVLPILCSPYAEPVVSTRNRFWLRPLGDARTYNSETPVPRALTAAELVRFLQTTSEAELERICEEYGWTL